MSTNLVIVAIPDENDRVWKVSSEKIPHMTLLFLGDSTKVNNLDSIMQFVGHAADRALNRFYLPVDHRGELGADQADVLFFKKGRYDFKMVREFRSLLLKDPNIRTAYDGATQFETPESVGEAGQAWIPHLTLGYPAAPAKPMPDDWTPTFYDVQFNKIAVWTGNYEGPEFLLKEYWDEMDESELMDAPLSVAMSDLEHHGVKGQRWGVRKLDSGGKGAHIRIHKKTGQATVSSVTGVAIVGPALVAFPLASLAFLHPRVRAEVKAARAVNKGVQADKKWQKEISKSKKGIEVHNLAADEINTKISGFNNDKRWKNIDLNKDPKQMAAYNKAFETEIMNPAYARAAIKVHGAKSPSGRYEFTIQDQATGLLKVKDLGVDVEGVRHAANEDEITVRFKITRDETGLIIGFSPEEDEDISMEQSDPVLEFLEHHGVKGMRWGVRKENVGNAAKSAGGKVGQAANALGRFASDVHFEAQTNPRVDRETGKESSSPAYHIVRKAAEKDWQDKDLPAIKAKPEYVKASKFKNRLLHPLDPTTQAYRKEVKEAYIQRLEKTANSMKNVSGSREYTIRERGGDLPRSKYYWEVSTREARHAAGDGVVSLVEVLMDEDGFITGTKDVMEADISGDTIAQTVDLGEAWLAHYGVKGMKWGVRRERGTPGFFETKRAVNEAKIREQRTPIAPRVQDSIGSSERKKTTISAKGGEDHPATEDALRVAAATQKLNKSGVHALTNKELQEVAQRLNLETQVSVLMGKRVKKGPGAKFVERQLQEAQNDPIRTFKRGKAAYKAAPAVVKTGRTLLRARRLAGVP